MYIVNSYALAVGLCFITMLCWGSWGNTQKLAAKTWRYELYYWDYVIGVLLFSIIMGLTLGSIGNQGRSFIPDLMQVSAKNFGSAFLGGIIFNASNILLSAALSLAGLAVAFPVGVGLALVLGVFINYFGAPYGDPFTLFFGVGLIVLALIFNGVAYSKMNKGKDKKQSTKGLLIALAAGFLMSFFYRFVAAAMDLENFESPTPGMVTPYTAVFILALGMLFSNFFFNTFVMKRPFVGAPVTYKAYFSGNIKTHSVGILGGLIWCLGTSISYIATGEAGAAISYALGQGATMVAALWGVFIWKEFKGASKTINILLLLMFILFITGLALIIIAGNK
jgi:glucose uptake protein